MAKLSSLEVFLNKTQVGYLTRLADDRIHFYFSDDYLNDPQYPVLSQSFYTSQKKLVKDLNPTQTTAPAFFANLLPEGHLRDYLARKAKLNPIRDYALLQLLGHDLPGAVLLKSQESRLATDQEEALIEADEKNPAILKFSLAGIQLKFSAIMQEKDTLTIPAHGMGGDWIVKLPSTRFIGLPENEFSMLKLAQQIGIEIPEIALMDVAKIENLPDIVSRSSQPALIVRRFDRGLNGERVHMEDFAQVYGIYPQKKYQNVSYANMATSLFSIIDENAAKEFIKRLIFNLLIGNSDMHLKNWALLYENPQLPKLAPAYDYVATQMFLHDPYLALSFVAGEKALSKINTTLLKRFALKTGLAEQMILMICQETIEATLKAWHLIKSDLPLTLKTTKSIQEHMLTMVQQLSHHTDN